MAQPIDFVPPAAPGQAAFTAADDVARLVETLHDSGTLRVLNGLFARFEAVTAVALGGLDTPEGRRGLANLLVVARLLGRIDTDALDRFVGALDKGFGAASARLAKDDPPGTIAVLGKLRDPAVRRGLDAVLTLLGTLGAEVHAPTLLPYSNTDGKPAATP